MLFEIHDIILHRLWKGTKALKLKVLQYGISDRCPAPKLCGKLYGLLHRLQYTTNRWYMNHVRSMA